MWNMRRCSARAGSAEPTLAMLCAALRRDLAPGLAVLADCQRPAGVVVTTREFSIEGGELTPNLKLRRAAVEVAFREPVERLYRLLETSRGAPAQVEDDGGQVVLCCLGAVS
jgi:hypothetical protein